MSINDYFDAERQDIALQASIEIEGIAIFAARELDAIQEPDPEIIAIKHLVLRIKELNSVIMGAVGDEFEKVASLRHRLNGRIASKSEAVQSMHNTEQYRAGAQACLNVLKTIKAMPGRNRDYYAYQESCVAEAIKASGVNNELLAGFIAAFAQYAAEIADAGVPNLDVWVPEAAMSQEEIKASRARELVLDNDLN